MGASPHSPLPASAQIVKHKSHLPTVSITDSRVGNTREHRGVTAALRPLG